METRKPLDRWRRLMPRDLIERGDSPQSSRNKQRPVHPTQPPALEFVFDMAILVVTFYPRPSDTSSISVSSGRGWARPNQSVIPRPNGFEFFFQQGLGLLGHGSNNSPSEPRPQLFVFDMEKQLHKA
eukprot:c48875_g1_i1.p1 GENE.c48875_g1_i1~~c48875_g1_i1.p1  ORF type:complete len:127 (+),score=14.77 c48875_g1_i1:115-495(+)